MARQSATFLLSSGITCVEKQEPIHRPTSRVKDDAYACSATWSTCVQTGVTLQTFAAVFADMRQGWHI